MKNAFHLLSSITASGWCRSVTVLLGEKKTASFMDMFTSQSGQVKRGTNLLPYAWSVTALVMFMPLLHSKMQTMW